MSESAAGCGSQSGQRQHSAPLPPPRLRLVLVLGALAMFGPFSIDTLFPAFATIARELDAPAAAVQQTVSVYLLGYALMSLFHGALSDALGRRPVLLAGIALFVLASAGCALATEIETLLFFRFLQGLCAGVGLIIGRAVIRDCADGADAQRLMSQVSMIFTLAPAVAPILGGWILGAASWQGIFWFLALLGVLIGLLTAIGLPETHPPERRLPLRSAVLLGQYRAMLLHRRFLGLVLVSTFNFAALFLYISSASVVVTAHLGLGERQFGWFFVPIIAGMLLGAYVTGRAAGRWPGHRLLMAGFACCLAATLLNLGYTLSTADYGLPFALLPLVLLAFGVALVFPQLMLSMLDFYPAQRGSASSMQAFISLMFQAMVAGLLSPWLSASTVTLALGSLLLTMLAIAIWRYRVRDGSSA